MQLGLLLFLGLAFIAGPVLATISGHPLAAVPTTMLIGTGVFLTVICAVLLVITKLYVKTKANEAFVRTGMGGMKVVQDGGAIVFPVIHELVKIELSTIRLQVSRTETDALITKDKLRADIFAEFYVRVQPLEESIKSAARSFGANMNDGAVTMVVEDKLVSALRNVAATKTLEELNTQRDEFIARVTEIVSPDLAHNGLTLETATISKLDQTDPKNLRDTNIFDAQGLKTIALTTQEALTERNRLEREGELARKQMDVTTRQHILGLERQQKETEAGQAAEIAKIQAAKDREAKESQIQSQRGIELADVEKHKAVEVAEQQRAQATEVAEREKQRALTEADQRVEVAQRQKEAAIAEAETLRVQKEAERAIAESERERAMQQVKTVQVTAEAEREKAKQVIAAQATAEKDYVTAAKRADGDAYKTQKDADARQAAAHAEAEAVRMMAAAQADATKATAEADQATQLVPVQIRQRQVEVDRAQAMIPVEVRAREVEVEKRRIEEVLKPELEARSQFGRAAQDFELAKLRIEKEAMVRIEAARATAQVYGKITATVYGSPEDVAKVGQAVVKGIEGASMFEGFFGAAGPKTQGAIDATGHAMRDLVQALTDKLGEGKTAEPSAVPEVSVAMVETKSDGAGSVAV